MPAENSPLNKAPLSLRAEAFAVSRETVTGRAGKNNDGENIPQEFLIERRKIVEELSHVIDAWIMQHIPAGEKFNQERLGALVQDIGEKHKSLIDPLVKATTDRSAYTGRPGIKIYEGIQGMLPDVWLLGWREDEHMLEATEIHDHVSSEAAFHVYQGCVDEIIYTFDKEAWDKEGKAISCQMTSRGLRRGSTATIPAPYVHVVSDHRDLQEAVTIHSYFPPLHEMNFYDDHNGVLVPKGNWKETAPAELHCGAQSGPTITGNSSS